MTPEPPAGSAPSRRTVLAGAAAVLTVGGELFAAAPAIAAGMPTLADVIAAALPTTGQTLAQVKQTFGATGMWADFAGEWCAWYPTWLLRGNGVAFDAGDFAVSTLYDHYPEERHGTVPRPGALVFYSGHVGLVTGVAGGYPTSIEGNTGYYRGATSWADSTVNTFTGGSARILGYAYPRYNGYDSMTGAGDVGPSSPAASRCRTTASPSASRLPRSTTRSSAASGDPGEQPLDAPPPAALLSAHVQARTSPAGG